MKRRIRDLGITAKLLLAPAGSVVAFVVLACVAFSAMLSQRSAIGGSNAVEEVSGFTARLGRIHANVYKVTSLASSSNDAKAVDALAKAQLAQIDALTAELTSWAASRRQKKGAAAAADRALPLLAEYRKQCAGVADLATTDLGMANTYMSVAERSYQEIGKILDEVLEREAATARAASAELAASSRRTMVVFVLVCLVAVLATGAIARTVARSIGDPLHELLEAADALTVGDLSHAIEVRNRDELGKLAAAFQEMVRSQQRMADLAIAVGRGDMSADVTPRSPKDSLAHALQTMVAAIRRLVGDAAALGEAAVAGDLAKRVDVSAHQGEFAKIVGGINGAMDAVVDPIREATAVLEQLARRDLRARVVGVYRGDHARIKDALNATGEALHDAVGQVAHAIEQVSTASRQIASSSQAVASGASEQAASLEETSSSLESMAALTKQATDHAQQANGLAEQAKRAAADGGAAMEQMTGAMEKIRASAAGTSQIIKDINEIAFQTNLLALNAAVEAARAGEVGRGFAVVADEVRSLALRSKEAANKTEDLIRQSVREAGEGEATALQVRERLGDISSSVTKVGDIVAEIAAAAREQAAGIDQVTRAVAQVNQVTQQNAASSEESSSAAAELSGEAADLAAMVSTFVIERSSQEASAEPEVRPLGRSLSTATLSAPPAFKTNRAVARRDRQRPGRDA